MAVSQNLGSCIAWKISAQCFTEEAGSGNSRGCIFHLSTSITSSETSLFSSESMICPEALLQSLLAAELSVFLQSSCHADGSLYRRFIQAEALLESAQEWVILAVRICMNAQPLSPGIKKTLKYISPV